MCLLRATNLGSNNKNLGPYFSANWKIQYDCKYITNNKPNAKLYCTLHHTKLTRLKTVEGSLF